MDGKETPYKIEPIYLGLQRLVLHRSDWVDVLAEDFDADYMQKLNKFLSEEIHKDKMVQPYSFELFKALTLCPYRNVEVVIMGDYPGHLPGEADGLAFSSNVPIQELPILTSTLFKEMSRELRISDGKFLLNLDSWATQGVLMINNVVTTELYKPQSHKGKGWERFTRSILEALNKRKDPIIFLLWGEDASKHAAGIAGHHRILSTANPHPARAHEGFYFSKPFTRINEELKKLRKPEINWKSIDMNYRNSPWDW